jgi:multidrug efflux pump subunit AcrB
MSFRNISAWCIRNPVPPIVFFALLMIAGVLSFNRMSVNDQPDIDFPAAIINIAQPGAAPSEMETQVTLVVEAAIRGVNGIDEINSSVREGNSSTFVQFAIGTPIDRAVNDVRDAVANVRGDLPDGILEPQVTRVDVTQDPLVIFSVEATDMTLEQLSWFVDNTVARTMRAVPGVATVSRGGGVSREIRVVLDPARMQSQGITASQVNQQLRALNLNAAGGRTEIAGSEQSVRVLGNAQTAYILSQTNINVGGGRAIKLADIAEVTDSFAEQRSLSLMDGQQVLSFTIVRSKGSSDVGVYDAVHAALDELRAENPDVTYTELYTTATTTKEEYKAAMRMLLEGAVLAIIVVYLFLRDWRATLISAIAIPLSAIPAFFFMDLMGFTLNFLSLLALSLVSGVLVDDAIVEIENIVRHMRMGKTAYQAAIDAADEIGLAVLATTMAIVAVFLPVGLMPGISGQFFKNFGLTVVAAVLVSLAVARLITPLVAAYFLKSHGTASHGEGPLMDWYMKALRWTLDTTRSIRVRARFSAVHTHLPYLVPALIIGLGLGAFGAVKSFAVWPPLPFVVFPLGMLIGFIVGVAVTAIAGAIVGLFVGYDSAPFFRWSLFMLQRTYARIFDHRIIVGGFAILTLVMTGVTFVGFRNIVDGIPTMFVPPRDNDFSTVRIFLPPGATLEQTERVANQAYDVVRRAPEVEAAVSEVSVGSASISLTLAEDRQRTSVQFERAYNPQLSAIPDARVSFQSQSGGGPGGGGRDVTLYLAGTDGELLNRTAAQIVNEMQALPQLVAPRTNADLQRPELIIRPRTQLAAELGVSTAALSQAIRIATLGEIDQNSAKFSLTDRQVPIRVVLAEESRRDLSTIENLPVPTATGGSVPLSVVADISLGSGPVSIQRTNQERRVGLGADLAPGLVSGDVSPLIDNLPTLRNLPDGVERVELGDTKWQAELVSSFGIALFTGVMLVFATLVLLYKRLLPPLVNMGSLLLAPLGAGLALRITGDPVSMPVFIGILLLFGIVAKNSILLVDFALEEMDKGVDKFAAMMDAGHKRAQPILMTTVAMVAGMIPVALSLEGDSSFRAPMGVTVIGGLIVSTILTLLIIPAGFSLAVGIEQRLGPWLRRKLLTYKPGDEDAPRTAVPQPAE